MTYSATFLALQQVLAGRYSLVRELGRGGMGIVFLARDLALERLVAIKLLPPSLAGDPVRRDRFLREARIAASLSHPHIVPIHAVEERDGMTWFVMTYVEGETLGARVRRAGPLPRTEAVRVIREVAWALGHAHARGVVHRDVKPDNVLLEAESGRALVTDFGIAQLAGGEPDEVAGTPHFMAPELLLDRAVADARSDLYALGVTAWFALTGRPPFDAPQATALLMAHAVAPVPALRDVLPGVAPRLAAAIERCLAKDPAQRWADADALAAECDAVPLTGVAAVPAAVRAFVREVEELGTEVASTLTTAGIAAGLALLTPLFPGSGGLNLSASVASTLYLVIALLLGTMGTLRVLSLLPHARRLRAAGYGFEALQRALTARDVERREEQGDPPARRPLSALLLAAGGAMAAVGGLAGTLYGTENIVIAPSLLISLTGPLMAVRAAWKRWSGGTPLWQQLLSGRVGRALLALGGRTMQATPLIESPTLFAVGADARRRWQALSPALRAQLGDVPALVEQLEQQALALRGNADDPTAMARFAAAAGALELVRLDLLRLDAQATPGELTQLVERVQAIGAQVDAARAGLALPVPTPTPT